MRKRVLSLGLAILMLFCLSGCKDDVTAYREKLSVIIDEVTAMDDTVSGVVSDLQSAINNADEDTYTAKLAELQEHCDTLKEKYQEIAKTAAPSVYEEEQKLLQQYADEMDKMLDASMQLYEIAYDFNVNGNYTDEILNKISELQEEIEQYSSSTTNFDDVLNKVMGYEEDSTEE